MSKKTDLCAALAFEAGVPVKEVNEQQRRLSESPGGFGPRFSKAKDSQVFSNMHLASQTVATMIRSPSRRAPLDVQALAETELTSDSFAKIDAVRLKITEAAPDLALFLEPRHSLMDAIAALYGVARRFPDLLEQVMFNTAIEIDHLRFDGAIYLEVEHPNRPGELIFADTLEYAAPKVAHRGQLTIVSRLPARSILAVATVADRAIP